MQQRLLKNVNRFVTVSGKASRNQMLALGPLRWPLFGAFLAYFVVFLLLPLGILALRGSVSLLTPLIPAWEVLTLDNFKMLFSHDSTRRAIVNTLIISATGAAVGTVFVALLTLVIHRSNFPFRRSLEYLALFPRAVPGIVAGMGLLYAMILFPPLGWIRNSLWILMAAYVMRYIPLAYGALAPSSMQLSLDLDRSARISGATWWQATRSIILPLMRPAMVSSYVLLFIYFFKEYTVAVFLFSPGNEVIGAVLLSAWAQGDIGVVSALATIQILITITFVICARKLFGIRLYS